MRSLNFHASWISELKASGEPWGFASANVLFSICIRRIQVPSLLEAWIKRREMVLRRVDQSTSDTMTNIMFDAMTWCHWLTYKPNDTVPSVYPSTPNSCYKDPAQFIKTPGTVSHCTRHETQGKSFRYSGRRMRTFLLLQNSWWSRANSASAQASSSSVWRHEEEALHWYCFHGHVKDSGSGWAKQWRRPLLPSQPLGYSTQVPER